VIQCIAIAMVLFFPAISLWFPAHLNEQSRAVETEQVDDSMNRLEEDPTKMLQDQQEEEEEQNKGGDSAKDEAKK
jgi:hypothetical protein